MQSENQIVRLLDAPKYGPLQVAYGKALRWHFEVFRKSKYVGCVLEHVAGIPVVVLPGVLNPKLMRTGEFFAQQLGSGAIDSHAEILDMGTGSGVCAIVAARNGRRVVAVDINPTAVRCARTNVFLNDVSDRVEVLQSDLFANVRGQRFDVVLFNPPFVRGVPEDDADRAWRSVDVAERFAAQLASHLKPRGFALVLLSTYGDAPHFLRQ